MLYRLLAASGLFVIAAWTLSCATAQNDSREITFAPGTGPIDKLALPAPFTTPSARNTSKVIGWPKSKMPTPAPGFEVSLFAENFDNPRQAYVLPNGDILVVEATREWPGRADRPDKSANRITLFRDTNGDGKPDIRETFLTGLNMPHGMAVLGNWFYVGNTNGVVRYPYRAGQTKIDGKGEKILDLPADGHYTRNLLADPSGKKFTSPSAPHPTSMRKMSGKKTSAAPAFWRSIPMAAACGYLPTDCAIPSVWIGSRKPKRLWTVVNERDLLGDDLVPDYLTSVKEGAFYGWPFSYFGQNEDPRKKGQRPDLVAKAIKPDYALGSHTAALGLAFYQGKSFPERYRGGAFIGMHGSWNRSKMVGFKVAFVPFANGKPAGPIEDILTGFIADESKFEAYGRPVGVTVAPDGSLLVADDSGGKVWRVTAKK